MTTARLSALHIYPVKSVQGPAPGEAAVEPWGLAGDRRWLVVDKDGRAITQREQPRLALARARPATGGGAAHGGITLDAEGMEELTVAAPAAGDAEPARIFGDPVDVVAAGAEAGAWFSAFLGVRARLAYLDDPARRRPIEPEYSLPGETVSLADSHPLLLAASASLGALNSLVAEGDRVQEGPLPMDRFRPNAVIDGTGAWAEDGWRVVRIGEVVFRVAKPCARCVITTTDQATAARGREPLRTLARHRRIGDGLMFGVKLIPCSTGTLRVGDTFSVLE
ncbi:MOSC N-terminal beta barrel domain-containing protein [Streptomyces sp. ICBB 8177]|uniref:MOSC domain-containing protein n=1 Tax=Streptomyces sp. ICBB 8177 TaxID=563922 RepID=UPI000D67A4DA|nr:MOSC N-terminal beta barrel domain-containing protein [Streptomyces sp. ICBB 8177]PWI41749.1 MOSC domain-containing protein [Streptomyces sp. ICBB 8177]